MKLVVLSFVIFCSLVGSAHCAGLSLHPDVYSAARATDTVTLKQIQTLINNGFYDKAIAQCRKEIKENNTNSAHRLKAHILLITAFNQAEHYDQALAASDSLYNINKTLLHTEDKLLRAFYFQRAYTYSGLHNQKYEIAYTQKALAVMERNPQLFSVAEFIVTYNDLYYYQLNYEDLKGLEITYSKYAAFFNTNRSVLNKDEYAHARRVLRKMEVTAALYRNRPDEAIRILKGFKKEVEWPLNEQDIAYLNSCFSHINSHYYFTGAYQQAISFGTKYLAFARQTRSSFDVMLAYSKIGASYEQLGKYDEGIKFIDLSLNAFNFGAFSASQYALQIIKAKCFSGKKMHAEATRLARQTIEEILQHKLKKPVKIPDFEIAAITDLNSHNYINIFATAGLLFIEKHKDGKQPGDLHNAEKLLSTSGAMFREFYLKGEYNPTLYSLHLKNAEGLLYIASQKYTNNPEQLTAILNIIEENSSQHLYKNYLRKSSPAGVKGIETAQKHISTLFSATRRQLANDEQLLKYYVLPNDIYVVQVDNKSFKLHRLGAAAMVRQATMDFVKNLGQPGTEHKRDGARLANILFPKSLKGKLTVIPDNFLNYLPFEALWMPDNKAFLVQQHDVSYVYSLAILNLNRNIHRPQDGKKVLIFNPAYEPGIKYNGFALAPLPASHKEADEIVATMDGVIINGQVSKADFLQRTADYPVYHFSMHAYMDQDNFNKSCLVFSKGEPLFFEELYKMRIPAELVVLGACNTGNGKLSNGEGIMSLAMAFSFAGTHASIFSLWKVPDQETAEMLGDFYSYLKKGYTKDEALAVAKRDFIRNNPIRSHPYFWAGFIVNGDNDALFTREALYWPVTGAAALTIVVLLMYFRKRLWV